MSSINHTCRGSKIYKHIRTIHRADQFTITCVFPPDFCIPLNIAVINYIAKGQFHFLYVTLQKDKYPGKKREGYTTT